MKTRKKLLAVCLAAMMLVSAGAFAGCSNSVAGTISDAINGINSSANLSEKETDATELSLAVKVLYSGVVSGTINRSTPSDELNNLSPSKLPDPSASASSKKEAGSKLTIQDAVDYQGLGSKINSSTISDFGYDPSDAGIYYKGGSHTGTLKDLTMSTTIGTIRGD